MRTLVGNSTAARENREAVRGLIGEYEDPAQLRVHLVALGFFPAEAKKYVAAIKAKPRGATVTIKIKGGGMDL